MNSTLVLTLLASAVTMTVRAGIPLYLATLGGITTEVSGVSNLGIEGIMAMGAVSGFAAALYSQNVWVGLAAAILVGGFLGLVNAFWAITLRAKQTAVGITLANLLGGGLANFLGQRLGPNSQPLIGINGPRLTKIALPLLSELPYFGKALFRQDVLVYLTYCLIPFAWFLLYKTKLGLNLRAAGDDPATADSLGIDVNHLRYAWCVVGGSFMGLGGAYLSLSYTPGWTYNLSGGIGWIAIAMVIFSQWDPVRAWIGALVFGGVNALQLFFQASSSLLSPSVLQMLPFLATLIVLTAVGRKEGQGAPEGLGIPFVREE